LKLKYHKLLSNFAFNFKLRRYTEEELDAVKANADGSDAMKTSVATAFKVGRCMLTLPNLR